MGGKWTFFGFHVVHAVVHSVFFSIKNKVLLRSLLLRIDKRSSKSNTQKRYSAYKEGVQAVYPNMGEGARIRLGFCFVEMVRATFPDDEYKNFRYSDYHVDENM